MAIFNHSCKDQITTFASWNPIVASISNRNCTPRSRYSQVLRFQWNETTIFWKLKNDLNRTDGFWYECCHFSGVVCYFETTLPPVLIVVAPYPIPIFVCVCIHMYIYIYTQYDTSNTHRFNTKPWFPGVMAWMALSNTYTSLGFFGHDCGAGSPSSLSPFETSVWGDMAKRTCGLWQQFNVAIISIRCFPIFQGLPYGGFLKWGTTKSSNFI